MQGHWWILACGVAGLVPLLIIASFLDKRNRANLGKRIREVLPREEQWGIIPGGAEWLPPLDSMPEELQGIFRMDPVLELDDPSSGAWVCVSSELVRNYAGSYLGSQAVAVIRASREHSYGLRFERRSGNNWKNEVHDSRFRVTELRKSAGGVWLLSTTDKRQPATDSIRQFFESVVNERIDGVQVFGEYLTVFGGKATNPDSYRVVWDEAKRIAELVELKDW
ncbi:MAG: hypothetical protein NXI07_02590 [bacterium]|nr:hypothetical protein [bacterium]